jgi:hypothetical protein
VNAGDWIALASAIGAVIAAVVAIWQARSAREAANAASRQAAAAEEQVSISRSQLEADMADRDEAEGPAFAIEDAREVYDGEFFVTATLVMQSGRPLSSIKIRTRGADVRWLAPYLGSHDRVAERMWHDVSPVAKLPVIAQMEWNASRPLNLTLDLECVEQGGKQRTWHRSCGATAEPARPEPGPWERYRRDE